MSYTHGHDESVLRSHRARTAQNSAAYLLPHLRTTDRLLDVGAGPGTITADLAGLVASVVALEVSEDATSYALKLLRTAGLVTNRREGRAVHYRLADGFPHQLVEHCLRQLLTIQPAEGGR